MGTAPLASEQAINRLSERWPDFPQNREITGKYRQEPPCQRSCCGRRPSSEAIGAIDGLTRQQPAKVLSRSGRAAMEVAAKEDPTAVVRVATQSVT